MQIAPFSKSNRASAQMRAQKQSLKDRSMLEVCLALADTSNIYVMYCIDVEYALTYYISLSHINATGHSDLP